jgi:hypothetical protein
MNQTTVKPHLAHDQEPTPTTSLPTIPPQPPQTYLFHFQSRWTNRLRLSHVNTCHKITGALHSRMNESPTGNSAVHVHNRHARLTGCTHGRLFAIDQGAHPCANLKRQCRADASPNSIPTMHENYHRTAATLADFCRSRAHLGGGFVPHRDQFHGVLSGTYRPVQSKCQRIFKRAYCWLPNNLISIEK